MSRSVALESSRKDQDGQRNTQYAPVAQRALIGQSPGYICSFAQPLTDLIRRTIKSAPQEEQEKDRWHAKHSDQEHFDDHTGDDSCSPAVGAGEPVRSTRRTRSSA